MNDKNESAAQKPAGAKDQAQIRKDRIISSDHSIYDIIRTKLDFCLEIWEQLKALSMNKQSDIMKLLNIAEILKTSDILKGNLDIEKIKELRPEDEYMLYVDEGLDYRVFFEQVKGRCQGSLVREMDILREKIRFLERLGGEDME